MLSRIMPFRHGSKTQTTSPALAKIRQPPFTPPTPTQPDVVDATSTDIPAAAAAARQERGLGEDEEFDPQIIRDFLTMLDFDVSKPALPPPAGLVEGSQKIIDSWNLEPKYIEPIQKSFAAAWPVAYMPCIGSSLEVQIYLTIYSTLSIYIDNMAPSIIPQLRKVSSQFWMGLADPECVYEDRIIWLFIQHITVETPKYFGPYGTGAIIKNTLDFFIGNLLESELPDRFVVPRSAARWPTFLRAKTGVSEAYAHFIYPQERFPEPHSLGSFVPVIPDISEFINKVNDILSFYKECVVSTEDSNFIQTESRMTGVGPITILRRMCKEQADLANEIRRALVGYPEALQAANDFISGYIMYHCTNSRYRLREIGIILGGKNHPMWECRRAEGGEASYPFHAVSIVRASFFPYLYLLLFSLVFIYFFFPCLYLPIATLVHIPYSVFLFEFQYFTGL